MGNPILGVFFHWLGGFASATFYVPYRSVKNWSWEIFWLTGGIFSWVIAPWVLAAIMSKDLLGVLGNVSGHIVGLCVMFGILWGFGGLTYGLTMRYLGLSLGMAVVLGLCTVFGTLLPPLVQGDFAAKLLDTTSGNIILVGLLITLLGIVIVAIAGAQKNKALSSEQKIAAVAEFNFRKGVAVAIFSGVMSSCFAFGLAVGEPVKAISAAAGTGPLWTGLPVLCLVMFGGLITNGVWCAILISRHRSAGQWTGRSATVRDAGMRPTNSSEAASEVPGQVALSASGRRPPLLINYLLCALGGSLWYFQFLFYTMGESQMGRFGFSSWTLHMASIIIFGTVWGFAFREWKDATPRVRATVWIGVSLLIIATVIIGYGNRLGV